MKQQDFEIRAKIIKETFQDNRKIICEIPKSELKIDKNIHQGGDFFQTEDMEIIDLEFQFEEFNEDELVKYVELAEDIYEKNHKPVLIYIICPKNINVTVKECEIGSDADFTIKLACILQDTCQIILIGIKEKIKYEKLDEEDLEMLKKLPKICDKSERSYYLKEYLKIINRYHY